MFHVQLPGAASCQRAALPHSVVFNNNKNKDNNDNNNNIRCQSMTVMPAYRQRGGVYMQLAVLSDSFRHQLNGYLAYVMGT